MVKDRLVSALALIFSLFSLSVSIYLLARNPLGRGLAAYDFSSPRQSIDSITNIIMSRDIAALIDAGLETFGETGEKTSKNKSIMKYLLDRRPVNYEILRSLEITESSVDANVGLILTFIRYELDGVTYHTCQAFKRQSKGRYIPTTLTESYAPPSDADKALQSTIHEFEMFGRLP
jgi:hypothetical protein